jgi:hypothetical protein
MSHLFRQRRDRPGNRQEFELISLGQFARRVATVEDGALVIAPFGAPTEGAFALLVTPGAHAFVNGKILLGRLKVLEHRDEIISGGESLFYSQESLPEIETYRPEPGRGALRCSLCRGAFQEGMAVVRCPRCGRLYHEIGAETGGHERRCWSYRATCGHCGHPTALSGESLWHPEAEDEHAEF